MNLMEYKGADALDLLADIIEPCSVIFSDEKLWNIAQTSKPMHVVKYALKTYKGEVLEIMARLDGVPVEQYDCNVLTLPVKLLQILNNKELIDFFNSQRQNEASVFSGAAMEDTQGTGEK